MRLRDTVTRLRAPNVTGPDGATIPGDWTNATEGQLLKVDYPAEFQPLGSTEDVVAQERTESTHKVFMPDYADVLSTDRIRFLGIDYQVDGQPELWRRGGRNHHLEVLVFRVSGG
jgi:hypothetical protein